MIKKITGMVGLGFMGLGGLFSSSSDSIERKPTVTIKQMVAWAESKKAHPMFISLASTFYNRAVKIGINPALVYAQCAKETLYLKYGGIVKFEQKNTCGLKSHKAEKGLHGNSFMSFNSWEDSIEAQVDHLALYAGVKGYPKKDTKDPRHYRSLFNTATKIDDLSHTWARDSNYGKSLMRMIKEMEEM